MKILRSIYPSLVWLGIIWTLSSLPSKKLPSFKIFGIDKLAHIFVYFVLGYLVNCYLKAREMDKTKMISIYITMLLLAAADESHQVYIPGRSVIIYDFLANAFGLGLASLLLLSTSGNKQQKL